MIQVNNINGKPETTPKKYYASAADSQFFYFFENENEELTYLNSLIIIFDLNDYKNQVNEAHNTLFQQLYTERDYLTIGEIPIWQNDEEFVAESLALQQWWVNTCKIVSAYLETVTEETALPIETFINSLPKLDN